MKIAYGSTNVKFESVEKLLNELDRRLKKLEEKEKLRPSLKNFSESPFKRTDS